MCKWSIHVLGVNDMALPIHHVNVRFESLLIKPVLFNAVNHVSDHAIVLGKHVGGRSNTMQHEDDEVDIGASVLRFTNVELLPKQIVLPLLLFGDGI